MSLVGSSQPVTLYQTGDAVEGTRCFITQAIFTEVCQKRIWYERRLV